MAVAMRMDALTIICGITLGIISWNMIENFLQPMERAAVTNSCSRNVKNSPRTTRAQLGQPMKPMTMTMSARLGPKMAESRMPTKNMGSIWKDSVTFSRALLVKRLE